MSRSNYWGLSGPLKSTGSLCCGVRCKRDYSIVNSGTTCDAALCHNSLATCFFVVVWALGFRNVWALVVRGWRSFNTGEHSLVTPLVLAFVS